jgi:hypothetical protein
MGHIAGRGGRFITVLPRSRAEDGAFGDWLQTHTPDWTQAARRGEPEQVYSTTPAPLPSAEGYRITWVHSTAKAARDGATRQARIEAGIAAVKALDAKLAGPRCRYKTRVAVEHAAAAALAGAHADRWVTTAVTQTVAKTYKQARRGRPGPQTSHREIATSRFGLRADIDLEHLAHDAASDGCLPLITNDTNLSDAQVLAAYRYQPNLERRHHLLKSVQDAAPVLLKNPAPIEGLFCCQFLTLLVAALIERQVRTPMAAAALDNIPLYPELRDCTAPSTQRILEIFTNPARHHLHRDAVLVKTFEPELTTQQQQILDLLGLAPTAYTQHR